MLVLFRKCANLRNLGFCYFVSKHAADTLAPGMHFQHDASRLLAIHSEDQLEHLDDKFHRGVIVIDQHDPVKGRLFRFRARLFYSQPVIRPCLEIHVVVVAHIRRFRTNAFPMGTILHPDSFDQTLSCSALQNVTNEQHNNPLARGPCGRARYASWAAMQLEIWTPMPLANRELSLIL